MRMKRRSVSMISEELARRTRTYVVSRVVIGTEVSRVVVETDVTVSVSRVVVGIPMVGIERVGIEKVLRRRKKGIVSNALLVSRRGVQSYGRVLMMDDCG
jgi:hypothetical protein